MSNFKKIKIAILGLLVICAFSDSIAQRPNKIKKNKMYTTESGLQYKITKKGEGKMPKQGDMVVVHYTGKLTNDTVFDSSKNRNEPFKFKIGVGQVIKGWDEGIALLCEGDHATLTIPANLGYGERNMGKIPANSTLIFDVELIKVIESSKPYNVTGKDTITTASGLKYVVVEKGNGNQAKAGTIIKVHYTGYFEDGRIFDSSVDRDEPIELPLGKGYVIPGWEEGMQLMKVGDKTRFIIPYQLAYGEQGNEYIPAKSTLIFDVEMLNVIEMKTAEPYNVTGKDTVTTASGLQYVVLEEGNGDKPTKGSKVKVHYTGYFENGKIFDSSVERNQPFEFNIGMKQVIEGWDEGVSLMKKGAKVRFIIPYQLAYGPDGYGPIPAKATLIFDVELIDFK